MNDMTRPDDVCFACLMTMENLQISKSPNLAMTCNCLYANFHLVKIVIPSGTLYIPRPFSPLIPSLPAIHIHPYSTVSPDISIHPSIHPSLRPVPKIQVPQSSLPTPNLTVHNPSPTPQYHKTAPSSTHPGLHPRLLPPHSDFPYHTPSIAVSRISKAPRRRLGIPRARSL